MENWKKKIIELMAGLALKQKRVPSVVPYTPSKLVIPKKENKYFARPRTKRTFAVSPKLLDQMLGALEEQKKANIHSIVVIKNGKLLCKASAPGYDAYTPHLSHSMSKTIVGLCIGFLYDDKKLDTDATVSSFFPEIAYADSRFANLTVHHLLCMRSGISFAEAGVVSEQFWSNGFFSSEMSFEPGEKFAYNSMNSYILARIAKKLCGTSLTELVKQRLLDPLGIEGFFWEKSAEDCEKGGFGVYMSCEAWARVGVMLMQGGVFDGKRIISEQWLKKSFEAHSLTPSDTGDFDYGYHIWVGKENRELLINGMLGQNVYINPDQGIVVSITCGNNELFSQSPALSIIRSYLGASVESGYASLHGDFVKLYEHEAHFFEKRHMIRFKAPQNGILQALRLRSRTPFDENFAPLLGEYAFADNNCAGVMPLFLSVMQNNYLGGIDKLRIERRGDGIFFTFTEGGNEYGFEAGVYGFKSTVMEYNGEKYLLNAAAEAMEDEDRNPIYKLELVYPELPNSKIIKLSFVNGRLLMRISETPDENIAQTYISSITTSAKYAFIIGLLEKKLGTGFIQRKLESVFHPALSGISTQRQGWAIIIGGESTVATEARESSTRLLNALITKFIIGNSAQAEKKEPNFFKRAILGIFSKHKSEGTELNDGAIPEGQEIPISDIDDFLFPNSFEE